MSFDPVTEAVAHFIGYFHIKIEEARLREQYDEFRALKAAADANPELPGSKVAIPAIYGFKEFEPGVIYQSAPEILFSTIGGPLHHSTSWYDPDHMRHPKLNAAPKHEVPNAANSQGFHREYAIMPPGDVAVIVSQYNSLQDNDFITMVDYDVAYASQAEANSALNSLIGAGYALQPISGLDHPGSEAQIGETILSVYNAAQSFQPVAADGVTFTVLSGSATAGIHVNGVVSSDVPDLDEYLPQASTAASEEGTAAYVAGEGLITVQAATTFEAGSNLLVNESFIGSSWTVSPVMAVVGDYVDINIISQVNAWQDVDSIDAVFATWTQDGEDPTLAFNIASFIQESGGGSASTNAAQVFPTSWTVTTISGNLVFLNWAEQLNFVTDNDVGILSNSGSQSFVQVGDNLATNSLSLLSLGQYYDLVIIGGTLYSANIILQTNILLDNDSVAQSGGLSTSGTGSASTQGNLLWNQATINTIGETNVESLPDAYLQAALGLANGDQSQLSGILLDPAFAGLTGLKVLYITGDLLNLQYIKQTNILGDADQVIIAAENAQAALDGEWTVATGANALVNIASITDAGPDGTIYVGGEIYSDALLYQAELISTDAGLGLSASDALATEAVVFLAEGMLDLDASDAAIAGTSDAGYSSSSDVMQTVTS
jgi:hypothetical protein